MKLFAFIMAVILLVQSIVPCADEGLAASKCKTEISLSTHGQGDFHPDDCPPLCTCSCCGCFSSGHSFVSHITINAFSISNTNAEYLPKAIQKIFLPIWQPPQLA
ncbi:MAG TPA: DUF6660 family protein [Parafilimonas sp.]|nr:DUF6660 family protein [Parafilimonas sp.]